MRGKSYKRDKFVKTIYVCRDVKVLGIGSIVRYFLSIIGILWFCYFVIFVVVEKL